MALDKHEAFDHGHCHGISFDHGGPSALQMSRRLCKSRSGERSPFKPAVIDASSIRMGPPEVPSPTLSERRAMTMSQSNGFSGVNRMLNPNVQASVEKSCERQVKFLA